MKKSKFQQLIRGMVSDLLEGKGTAPGSPAGHTGYGTPGSVSKGGFTLQDFNKVLGGTGGRRTKSKDAGGSGARSSVRTTKASLFKGGRSVDQWRLDALKGGKSVAKSQYQKSQSKSKDVSANISSLAAVRKTDDNFRKQSGGRKTNLESARMKVNSTYINQKSKAITAYSNMISGQKDYFVSLLKQMDDAGAQETIEYAAVTNLLDDLSLRYSEYVAKWDFATAAYSGNQSAMDSARNVIDNLRNDRLKRERKVGKGHYTSVAPWAPKTKYAWGDVVTDKNGNKFTAINTKGYGEFQLGEIDPGKGSPIWRLTK